MIFIYPLRLQSKHLFQEDKLEDSKEKPDWVSIGFQGSDPITDFRGGGLLSLSQLIYFCENYPEKARNLNVRASHPTKGYGLAITGINLTVLLTKALQAGALKKVDSSSFILNII